MNPAPRTFDVAIVGAGLAGLALARQLHLETEARILILERRSEPTRRQKVGESTVQLSGYYLGRVLDLEPWLLEDHYLKYNLRFYWPAAGRRGDSFEDFHQVGVRQVSNVASYQIDRNRLEARLREWARGQERIDYCDGVRDLDVEVATQDTGPHRVSWTGEGATARVNARWLVDASGRVRWLTRRLGLERPSPIRHGASFLWVDGQVDIERLAPEGRAPALRSPRRRTLGHFPLWLATNHFCGPGWWFWVIPLRGRTSLGLVFDRDRIPFSEVSSPQRLLDWVGRELPLFAPELARREVLDHAGFRDFAYDCEQAVSADRWALTGESARFSDPLYSPGLDLVALHNTVIVDLVRRDAEPGAAGRCRRYDTLLRSLYEAYVPAYAEGYTGLGDPEAFALKYSWELAIYFTFYVFPFVNGLFTEPRFLPAYFRRFARLGETNRALQRFLAAFVEWKLQRGSGPEHPVDLELTRLAPLAEARETFYRVGVSVEEAREELDRQLGHLDELARFTVAHVTAVVLDEPQARHHAGFVRALDPASAIFDPKALAHAWAARSGDDAPWLWSFDPSVLDGFAAVPSGVEAG